MKRSLSGQGYGQPTETGDADDILRTIALLRDRDRLHVGEVSDILSVSPQTAHRLLSTLHFHGFVTRASENGSFAAGSVLVELGLSVVQKVDMRMQLRPFIEKLSREVGETVNLMTLSKRDALFLDSIEGDRMVRVGGRTGQKIEAHLTAGGKALLAELTPAELKRLLGRQKLVGHTASSLDDLERLAADLEETRRRGYAISMGENEADVVAIAKVIPGDRYDPKVAVSVSAPSARMNRKAREQVAEALLACVADILRR
jgi:DNA-binding IclR family transcriptional regulator